VVAAAPQDTLRRRPAGCPLWLARAFGIELALGFEAPALRQGEVEAADDPTTLELVYAASLESHWRDVEAEPLGWMPDGHGGVLLEIRRHSRLGVMFAAGQHGRYLIGSDSRHVACAPPAVAEWYWQRMLIGQVLPLLAALRGLHLIHASAVSLGDHAIAIAGAPGAGKSTLALEFALRGRSLLAEDVLALRLDGGRAVAEPGVSLVNLRPSEDAERLVDRAALPVLGRSHKIHVDLPRAPHALPLSALYLLEPADPGAPPGPSVEPLPAPSPRDLIGTAFVPYLARAEHLLRHLEVAAAVARTASVARVRVERGVAPAELADRIEAHAA
jgi:hypothetical protein